jgi:hypothetical protein
LPNVPKTQKHSSHVRHGETETWQLRQSGDHQNPAAPPTQTGQGSIFAVWKNGRRLWKGELPLRGGVKTCTAEIYIECEQKLDTLVFRYGSLLNLYAKDTLCHYALECGKQQEEDGIDINTYETQRHHIEVSIAPARWTRSWAEPTSMT